MTILVAKNFDIVFQKKWRFQKNTECGSIFIGLNLLPSVDVRYTLMSTDNERYYNKNLSIELMFLCFSCCFSLIGQKKRYGGE